MTNIRNPSYEQYSRGIQLQDNPDSREFCTVSRTLVPLASRSSRLGGSDMILFRWNEKSETTGING